MKRYYVFLFVFALLFSPATANANDMEEIKNEMRMMKESFNEMKSSYEAQLKTMQARIDQLESQDNTRLIKKQAAEIRTLQKQLANVKDEHAHHGGGPLAGLGIDVAVSGDVIYKTSDKEGAEGDDDFNLREVELIFGAEIDDRVRGDMVVAIENEDGTEVAIEEGYLTLKKTPIEGVTGKVGKFRPSFGKANRTHLHALPWSDYPLSVQNFLGEEGFTDAGISITYALPEIFEQVESDVTFQAFNNNDAAVFGGGEEEENVYLFNLTKDIEMSEELDAEIGGSFMFGENENGGSSDSQVVGIDATFVWAPAYNDFFKKLTSQTEVFISEKEADGGATETNSKGWYTSLVHQFADQWEWFYRYDYSETPDSSSTDKTANTAGLTFQQNENVFWRVQYSNIDDGSADNENVVWFQMDFLLGGHGDHDH